LAGDLKTSHAESNGLLAVRKLEVRLLRSEAEAVILHDPAFPSDACAPN
jgi:hypothetical protein